MSVEKKSPREEGEDSSKECFFVVGIGYAEGGRAALKDFFLSMPSEPDIAFVVVPEREAENKGSLHEWLSHYTPLKVTVVQEGMALAPNHVYLAPPDREVLLEGGKLRWGEPLLEETDQGRSPVDTFFESLAQDAGEYALAILLSGKGKAGATGAKAIKSAGGMVLAQLPETAPCKEMPFSAFSTGSVAHLLPPSRMPETLLNYVHHFSFSSLATPKQNNHLLHNGVLEILQEKFQHDFTSYKKNTLRRRIVRQMRLYNIKAVDQYIQLLHESSTVAQALFNDLLIGVTGFFREAEAWDVLQEQGLPLLVENSPPTEKLRFWVPGCASGEEAYTLAMICSEYLEKYAPTKEWTIFATDIDKDALQVARSCLYHNNIEAEVSASRLARFFVKKGDHYQVRPSLREKVLFSTHNLLNDPPFSRLNLISCRNLLIYLETEMQEKLYQLFHFALRERGLLLLGHSETMGAAASLFQCLSPQWRIYRRLPSTEKEKKMGSLFPFFTKKPSTFNDVPTSSTSFSPTEGLSLLVKETLLQEFAHPTVLINRQYEVLYYHGDTQRYLHHPSGPPTNDLLQMIAPSLRIRLRGALHRAFCHPEIVTLWAKSNDTAGKSSFGLRLHALPQKKQGQDLLLVSFLEPHLLDEDGDGASAAHSAKEVPEPERERELQATLEELHLATAELEATNESLKHSNEEVHTMNEELRSSNEELQLLQEELTSVNEELDNSYQTLQEKFNSLEAEHFELTSLIQSSEVALLFLDTRLRLRRYTPPLEKLFNLQPSDLGRLITDLTHHFREFPLTLLADQVLDDLTPREKILYTHDGRCFKNRILPFRTQENTIDGVVLAFAEITPEDNKK